MVPGLAGALVCPSAADAEAILLAKGVRQLPIQNPLLRAIPRSQAPTPSWTPRCFDCQIRTPVNPYPSYSFWGATKAGEDHVCPCEGSDYISVQLVAADDLPDRSLLLNGHCSSLPRGLAA